MRAALPLAARCWWRLAPLTPLGRRHEKHVRAELGMPRRHPESVTRMPSRRSQRVLDALQGQAWPDGEWADVIRYHLEGP